MTRETVEALLANETGTSGMTLKGTGRRRRSPRTAVR
jgi:hypothetical protein